MSQVTVYRWQIYDITSDGMRTSRRWATTEAVERVKGVVIEGSGVAIDNAYLDPEAEGMTAIGFDPRNSRGGFQRQVRVE